MAKVKETGCVKTVVSHALQVSFGPRKAPEPDGQEIIVTFKSRGVALQEVVSVLRNHITRNAGENRLLTGWVDSLTKAAVNALKNADILVRSRCDCPLHK
jgi:hypothetical protein